MPLRPDLEIHLVNTIEECWAMKRWLSEDRGREILGLDTETSGLDPYAPDAKLRTIQIGDERAGWTVPFDGWGGAAIECLNDWQGPVALHNASFDAKWLKMHADYQVPWHRLHDTMLHARIMRPGKPAGLKNLSVELVDPRANAGEVMLKDAMSKQGWGWGNIPVDFEPYWAYAALDPVITVELWKQLRADVHYPKVFDLEMSTLRVCTQMEESGARVDLDYCREKMAQLEQFVESSKQWGQDNLGISISSNVQLARYFEQTLQADITERTGSGAPSVNEEQLKKFIALQDEKIAPVAQAVLSARKADKLRSSYFSNFIKMERDSILHPSINTMGAVTGRMSITNPALQTLPKGDALVRGAFIPREGNAIITSDLDQVEFRMFSCLSGDEALMNTFHTADATGSDAFTEIGRTTYSDPTLTKKDKRRNLIKTYIYSKLYGAQIAKQAASAGVSVPVMQAVSDALNAKFPGIEGFQQNVVNVVGQRERAEGEGYVITPTTGRRLPVERGKAYKGTNYIIQSSAADIFKYNLLKMDAMGLTEWLVVPVHDEIVLDVPQDQARDVLETVRQCMTTTEGWPVPLTADGDGPFARWGDKYSA